MSIYNKKFWDEYRVQKQKKVYSKPKNDFRKEGADELKRLTEVVLSLQAKIDELIKKDEAVHNTLGKK